jgi:hypothetical protein
VAFITADLIAYSATGTTVARAAIAGSPAANRDLRAHFP